LQQHEAGRSEPDKQQGKDQDDRDSAARDRAKEIAHQSGFPFREVKKLCSRAKPYFIVH
jgi:hypothetical protein